MEEAVGATASGAHEARARAVVDDAGSSTPEHSQPLKLLSDGTCVEICEGAGGAVDVATIGSREASLPSCADWSYALDEARDCSSGQRCTEAALLRGDGRAGARARAEAASRGGGGKVAMPPVPPSVEEEDLSSSSSSSSSGSPPKSSSVAASDDSVAFDGAATDLEPVSWPEDQTIKKLSPNITESMSPEKSPPAKTAKKRKSRAATRSPAPRSDTVCYYDGIPLCKVLAGLLDVGVSGADSCEPPPKSSMVKGSRGKQKKQSSGAGSSAAAAADRGRNSSHEDPSEDELKRHAEQAPKPACACRAGVDKAPCYTQLGVAKSIEELRQLMEQRTGFSGNALRIEKIRYTGEQAETSLGCPAAKWVLRRSGDEEKALVCVRQRTEHVCRYSLMVVAIVLWDGVPKDASNHLYNYLSCSLPLYGFETDRGCSFNKRRTCGCQGFDKYRHGASFSFGCSFCMFHGGCKFANSRDFMSKFRLRERSIEEPLEGKMQVLSQFLAPMFEQVAPKAYENQVKYEDVAKSCRLGFKKGRPFSGLTVTMDYCAHPHRDKQNMQNGCTLLVTLTKEGVTGEPADDRQLHVLPLYALEDVSLDVKAQQAEAGSMDHDGRESILDGMPLEHKIQSGMVEVQTSQVITVRHLKDTMPKLKKSDVEKCDLKLKAAIEKSKAAVWQAGSTLSGRPPTAAGHGLPSDGADASVGSPVDAGSSQRKAMPSPPSPERIELAGDTVNECCQFDRPTLGGVGIELAHGSVLFEVADREMHASTALCSPNRYSPTRMSLVLYQHRKLNYSCHGRYHLLKAAEQRQAATHEALLSGQPYVPKSVQYKRKRDRVAAFTLMQAEAMRREQVVLNTSRYARPPLPALLDRLLATRPVAVAEAAASAATRSCLEAAAASAAVPTSVATVTATTSSVLSTMADSPMAITGPYRLLGLGLLKEHNWGRGIGDGKLSVVPQFGWKKGGQPATKKGGKPATKKQSS